MGVEGRTSLRWLGWLCLVATVGCSSGTSPGPIPVEGARKETGTTSAPPSCVPTTCEAQGKNCGIISDHCGGTLQCGGCASGESCGGGGGPNVCGPAQCQPLSCRGEGKNCGVISDGCGGVLECGSCSDPELCGGGGSANVCGIQCIPLTCETRGSNCGTVSDGCGGQLECGGCSLGEVCGAAGKPNVCALPPAPPCADFSAGAALPVSFEARVGTKDRHTQPCGYNRSTPEVLIAWTAPEDGVFVLDTTGSTFDTVLTVREGSCDGRALACEDNGIHYGNASRLTLELVAGTTVLIAVDGATTDHDYVQLHVNRLETTETAETCTDRADNDADGRVDCSDSDCAQEPACGMEACTEEDLGETVPGDFASTDLPTVNGNAGSCGGQHSPDVGLRFTAPEAGGYRFIARAQQDGELPPVLYVHGNCRGLELACSGGPAAEKVIELSLEAGQDVIVVVDGPSPFEVTVDRIPVPTVPGP